MAKEAFYFTHDYGSRNDPKLQKVLMKLGHEGKSVYWDLVEMLYEEGGYLLLEECENYAFALRTHYDCIAKLINDFDLFQKDDKSFWSNSILRRLDKRDEKSKKASESAKTRWAIANALKNDANASKLDAIKESKGKESKDIPELPLATSGGESNSISSRADKFVDKFNTIKLKSTGTIGKFRTTEKVLQKFKSRIKNYQPDQIIIAIKNAFSHQWHKDNNYQYLTPEYILREEILERYINVAPADLSRPIQNFHTDNKPALNHANR